MIEKWSETVILAELPPEPEIGEELKSLLSIASTDSNRCDIVLDLSRVDIITGTNLSKMVRLKKAMAEHGHRLVLYGLCPATRGIFAVTGLGEFFEFVKDKFAALALVQ